MKTFYLKIREKFISEIKNNRKKHEFRLATPERLSIKVGDLLVLISNQDKKNFVKTSVQSIKRYKDWESAISENWKDFENLYSSIEEALKDCYKFYTKNEVENFGIVVFEIEQFQTKYEDIDILLDTNIIIKRESSNNASFEIASLFNWFGKKNITTYIHSETKKELSKYSDEKIKQNMLTKLNSYNELPKFEFVEDEYFIQTISRYSQDPNGLIDNMLLREIYDNNVKFLLTDDNLMLRKAEDLYIRDRVITSSELLKYFESSNPKNVEYKMLAVKLKDFSEIDLNSSFFDTLREDYEGIKFDNWFKKKAKQKEKAYVFEDEEGLKGFLYLKLEDETEDYSHISPILLPNKRLKIGTFKIERTGFRLGERFLKIIFDNARKLNVNEVYVTLFEDKRDGVKHLKTIMEEWGFVKYGLNIKNGETILVKSLTNYNDKQTPKFNFPLIKSNTNKFILPILPQYHTDLFPDLILKNENMHLYEENKAHRYALEKIYLSGAFDITAKSGDLILIYRNGERYPKKYSSVITGVAIVQSIVKTKTIQDCLDLCKNRSIFTEEEIKKNHTRYPTVVKLLDYMSFKNNITLNQLYQNKIIAENSGPRPFTKINNEQFKIIFKLGMEE